MSSSPTVRTHPSSPAAAPASASNHTAEQPTPGASYTVKKGDDLDSIARRALAPDGDAARVSAYKAEIDKHNNLKGTAPTAGQELQLPPVPPRAEQVQTVSTEPTAATSAQVRRETSQAAYARHANDPMATARALQLNDKLVRAGSQKTAEPGAGIVSAALTNAALSTSTPNPALVNSLSGVGGFDDARQPVDDFTSDPAVKEHMPVRFLRSLQEPTTNVTFNETVIEGDSYEPTFDRVNLTSDTVRGMRAAREGLAGTSHRPGGTDGVLHLYHESTHAYFDVYKDVPSMKAIHDHGVNHYRDAPMEDGTTCEDPERLFQEASACYVSQRAATYSSAVANLKQIDRDLKNGTLTPEQAKTQLRHVRKDYNDVMKERTFGYADGGPSGQNSTTRPISPELKSYLDQHMLEGRIADDFDANPEFAVLCQDLPKVD